MSVPAEAVRQLRERTGAGMMECKKALVETGGDLDSAAELMRKQGLAKADKKATRIAAEGVVALAQSADGKSALLIEINCETDFVARGDDFVAFAKDVADKALAARVADVEALLQATLPSGDTVDGRRRALIAKIGENISVRRLTLVDSAGVLGSYLHGARIGTLVALEGGDASLARDLAMHIAASNPRFLSAAEVPADEVAKERSILTEQAQLDPKNQGKPPAVLTRIVEGKVAKALSEITLLGQPFVKDPDTTVEKLLLKANAKITRFVRLQLGEGIEKKQDDFVAEVQAQAQAAAQKKGSTTGNG